MGNTKKIPNSDDGRVGTLTKTKDRIAHVDPADNPVSDENTSAINSDTPDFIALRNEVHVCEEEFHGKVSAYSKIIFKLKNKASHGLQLVDFKIIDEDSGFTPSTRSLYGLTLDGKLPSMNNEEEIIQAANNFVNGETARVAAGGTLLTDIKKSDVVGLLAQLNSANNERQDAKTDLINAQIDLADKRKTIDELIPKVWGDIEHASQNMPAGAQHEYQLLWGIEFEHTPDYGFVSIKVEDIDTHAVLPGASLRIGNPSGKGGAKATTDNFGTSKMKSKNFEKTSLIVELALYDRVVVEIQIVENDTIYVVVKMKKSV
ncbi:MAG: hypothetical protein WCH34_09550 [Bacteroidota bacterium]